MPELMSIPEYVAQLRATLREVGKEPLTEGRMRREWAIRRAIDDLEWYKRPNRFTRFIEKAQPGAVRVERAPCLN